MFSVPCMQACSLLGTHVHHSHPSITHHSMYWRRLRALGLIRLRANKVGEKTFLAPPAISPVQQQQQVEAMQGGSRSSSERCVHMRQRRQQKQKQWVFVVESSDNSIVTQQ